MKYSKMLAAIVLPIALTIGAQASPMAARPPKRTGRKEQRDLENAGILDEEYEMEPFYQGLPIFNSDGSRAPHLFGGQDYRMTSIDVGGNPVACWRAQGPEWDSRTGLAIPDWERKARGLGAPIPAGRKK